MSKEKKFKGYMCTSMKVWILRKGTLKGVISVQKQSCVKIGKCMSLKKHKKKTIPILENWRKRTVAMRVSQSALMALKGWLQVTWQIFVSDLKTECMGEFSFFMLDCDMFRSMIHCSKDKEMEITHQRDYLSHIWKHWDNWIVPVGTKQAKMMRELFWSI